MGAPTVLTGDCLAVMPTLDADSVDAIVTDPPYGLKFMGKAWDHGIPGEPFWAAALRVAKPGAHLVAFGGTRTFHRLACAIEDAGWEIRDCLSWLYGSGFPKSHNGAWGGTALKPAWEPIILARKPLVGTVAANYARYGTGALNIDGCRIGATQRPHIESLAEGSVNAFGNGLNGSRLVGKTDVGRWPANVCLDHEAADMLDDASGELASGHLRAEVQRGEFGQNGIYGKAHRTMGRTFDADSGGASRFFYTSKASRAERNAGLDWFSDRVADVGDERPSGTFGERLGPRSDGSLRVPSPTRNAHPTVKPLDLMQWLCRLVTPKRGLILDPFCGSGTTGRAAVAEGFDFLGIELSEEYAAIARARIAEYAPLFAAFTPGDA